MTTIRQLVAKTADWVAHSQPVQSAGALAAAVLGVLAWLGFAQSAQSTQIVGTVVAVVFPLFTHWLAHLAAYSPRSVDVHVAEQVQNALGGMHAGADDANATPREPSATGGTISPGQVSSGTPHTWENPPKITGGVNPTFFVDTWATTHRRTP